MTVIEVALIVTLMVAGGPQSSSLARDTVFAAVMITTNGIVGLSLLLGSLRYGLARFNSRGHRRGAGRRHPGGPLALVLPVFTVAVPGPEFSPAQLQFAAIASLALYGSFVMARTVHHRDFSSPSAAPAMASWTRSMPVRPAPWRRDGAASADTCRIFHP